MKRWITFFLLVTLAASVAHYLAVLGLTQVAVSATGPTSAFLVAVLWVFTAPMNFLLSSSFGETLSPARFQVLFVCNSLLWGLAVGAIILWRKLKYE